jgi:two-component system, cell cycle response regulator
MSCAAESAVSPDPTESFFQSVLNQLADAIVVVSRRGDVVFANPAAERLFETGSGGLNGKPFGFPVRSGKPQEIHLVRRGKEPLFAEMRVIEGKIDDSTHFLVSLRDITDHVRLRKKLIELSTRDTLTGLHNRRGLTDLAKKRFSLAVRKSEHIVALLVDLDELKKINDGFGHREGDQALIDTARLLRETYRESDLCARIGGDEFVVITSDAEQNHVKGMVGRLQKNVEKHNRTGNRSFKLSLSVGFAVKTPDMPCSLDHLISLADSSMYYQKKSRPAIGNECSAIVF